MKTKLASLGRVLDAGYAWLLALILPVFILQPVLAQPIEEHAIDSAAFHIYRGVVFSAARADGWLYPRWVQSINAGLGGPLFSFYSPLVYSLMDALYRLGMPHPLAWRVIISLALLAASTGMFCLALELFKRADVALLCAASFTYAPYLMQEFFYRGSPQGLGIAVYPWVLFCVFRLAAHRSAPWFIGTAVSWAVVILLHNVAALLLVPILGMVLVVVAWQRGRKCLWACLLALVVGSLLCAFYVLPFFAESRFVQLDRASSADFAQPVRNPLSLADLLSLAPVLDTGLANNSVAQATVSPLHLLGLVLAVAVAIRCWPRERRPDAVLMVGLAGLGLAAVWLQTSSATAVWAALPVLDVLQFRWRLLSIVGLVASIAVGYIFREWPPRFRGPILGALMLAFVLLELPAFYPQLLPRLASFSASPSVAEAQEASLRASLASLTTFGELLPRWRQEPFTAGEAARAAASPIANLPTGSSIANVQRRSNHWQFELTTPIDFRAALYLLYYPGWQGAVDGRQVPLRPMESTGYTLLDIPAGTHTVSLWYAGTVDQHVGDALSLVALGLLILLAALWREQPAAPAATPPVWMQPRWWIPVGVLLLAGVKAYWVDPQTTWLRRASTVGAIQGAQVQTNVEFGNGIHLYGYSIGRELLDPPNLRRVTLYWQIDRPVNAAAHTFVHVVGTRFDSASGYPMLAQEDKELPAGFPIERWQPGMLYCDVYRLSLPQGVTPGEYQFEIGWWLPETGKRLRPTIAAPTAMLAPSPVDSLLLFEPAFQAPAGLTRRNETLGQGIRLLGYRLDPGYLRPGQALHLTLCWQSPRALGTSYTVFTHLLDGQGQLRAGHDGIPVDGLRPTNRWLPGEVVVDHHDLVVPMDAAPGGYAVEVGLYEAESGRRLPAYDSHGARVQDDRILLTTIEVGP